jgi:hypothetical protein
MKTVYFDCFAGVSGDMILGALIDSGLPLADLESQLSKLGVEGWSLHVEKVVKNGITGTSVKVITEEQSAHRHLSHISKIIEASSLSAAIKSKGLRVFQTLAKAEAKIHNTTPEKIHFHEVGALDAIVDVMGAVIGLELLGATTVCASPIHVGTGFVQCAHGKIPVPAPATLEILRGTPTFSTGIASELTTPTGSAILTTLAEQFGPMPSMTIDSIGYGAGSRDLEIPNLLRLIVGSETSDGYEIDHVELIEANIDDMNPEHFDYVIDKLLSSGALDVTLTPMMMKKNRPATCLGVMVRQSDVQKLMHILFTETTTIGVRRQTIQRQKLPREVRVVTTPHGEVGVKIARLDGKVRVVAPEYDDCRRLAEKCDLPLKEIYRVARLAAYQSLGITKDERSNDETV